MSSGGMSEHMLDPASDYTKQWQTNCSRALPYIKQLGVAKFSRESNKNAVFIELGAIAEGDQMDAHEFLVRNTITRLGKTWMHTLVAGQRGCAAMFALRSRISPDVNVLCYDAPFLTVDEYNDVFKSVAFWEKFPKGHMLMYQADTIILRHGGLEYTEDYDYIGAPCPRRRHDNAECVGSGDFTIRSVEKMIEIIEKVEPENVPLSESTRAYMVEKNLTSVPEDVFFSTAMLLTGLGRVADFETARSFVEESVLGNDPLGVHQIWTDRPWKPAMDFSKMLLKLKHTVPCQSGRYYSSKVTHRGGWRTVVEYLIDGRIIQNCTESALDPEIPALVDMMEFTPLEWNRDLADQVLGRPWIGISHLVPDNGYRMMENYTFDYLIEGEDYFKEAFKNCKGIIFLSKRMQDYWTERLNAGAWMSSDSYKGVSNTVVLMHPVDVDEYVPPFDADALEQAGGTRKIVLLGQQLRRVHTIYQLDPGPGYEKVWSPGVPEEQFNRIRKYIDESAAFEGVKVTSDEYHSVNLSYFEDHADFDNMMATSYIIVDCYDASANNAILEAIRANTPIFTRSLPAHIEYLGSGYPLFFDSVEALGALFRERATLDARVREAANYLRDMDKTRFSLQAFGKGVRKFIEEAFVDDRVSDVYVGKPECLECESNSYMALPAGTSASTLSDSALLNSSIVSEGELLVEPG